MITRHLTTGPERHHDAARRRMLQLGAGLGAALLPLTGRADAATPGMAELLRSLRLQWYLPGSTLLREQAEGLRQALAQGLGQGLSAPQRLQARQAWITTMAVWTRLNAVSTGPLLQRRSAQVIDFQPSRPKLVEQQIEALRAGRISTPPEARALDLIGTPAKGLPALELLLWHPAHARADAATTAYATALADDLVREARALEQGWQAEAQRNQSPEERRQAFTEFVSQWLGGVEALRWRQIERPLLVAGADERITYPRQLSGQTALAWRSHWEALRTLMALPEPGAASGLVTVAMMLRGQRQDRVVEGLGAALRRVDVALRQLRPQDGAERLNHAVKELGQLKRFFETDAAAAAEVQIGFTDNDGD